MGVRGGGGGGGCSALLRMLGSSLVIFTITAGSQF